MKPNRSIFYLVITLLVFTACSADKRLYRPGYHITWKTTKHPVEERRLTKKISESLPGKIVVSKVLPSAQEVAYNTNAVTASASEDLNFTPVQFPPIFTNKSTPSGNLTAKADRPNETRAEFRQMVKKEKGKSAPGSGSGKSQVTALLLAIFVGVLGIHRFYLGYTGIGVIQLLTLGGCGIWSLIDLIMIITGDLQPKEGRYEKEL
jgi:hypothetical protein